MAGNTSKREGKALLGLGGRLAGGEEMGSERKRRILLEKRGGRGRYGKEPRCRPGGKGKGERSAESGDRDTREIAFRNFERLAVRKRGKRSSTSGNGGNQCWE